MTNSFNAKSLPHKFFNYDLNLNLHDVANQLRIEYDKILNNKFPGVSKVSDQDAFSYTNSVSTQKYKEYNVFQMYHYFSHELYSAIFEMVQEACKYYNIDYNSEQWMVQSWFNINSKSKGGRLDWHDHQEDLTDVPAFHGYFCVNAEPSQTLYLINDIVVPNENKNNRAILSAVGYPHAVAPWEWDDDRITIAYDVIPLRTLIEEKFLTMDKEHDNMVIEQHYIPLPKIRNS